ncbi:thiamine pyrophosphate-binding protein [Nocardia sp. NBC_01503]|uniref:thiamine pyrophosphate-binding protein n=1 Tax=Nocardia sp. NBC_01503 TaxID=2975997 RepID=UPI002E7B1B83|nr:thiamine pyrophosphate-binding protein [Nocardia sp. NBC_01503]WTL29072.1 thiamine pyrophosphate-binding protein [Nocardia sp. NBC_01503]
MKNRRIAEYLVRGCAELGVRHIFGVDGANIEDIYDAAAASDAGVRGVVAKHEFSAATMADGYARAAGGLGVVAATSGGGAMNLVAGLAESFTSQVPVLALIGQPPRNLEGKGTFQDTSGRAGSIDALRLFETVSRYCARVERPEDLPEQFATAVEAALGGGPAVLLLPKDIQRSPVPQKPVRRDPRPPTIGHPADMVAVATALRTARTTGKILVIAGDQVARDNAREALRDLAVTLDAAVGVTPEGKGVYGPRDPGYCGVAGTMGHPELLDIARTAALCLLVGTRLPATAQIPLRGVPLAGIGRQPPYPPAVFASSSNLAATLPELTAFLRDSGSGAETSEPKFDLGPQVFARRLRPPAATGPGLRYREVMDTISELLPTGSAVFADAGNTGAAAVHYLDLPENGRFGLALGMGGMGYSFGAAIGSMFAAPRPTYVLAGDGSFLMHGMEIHTAIEHALPITFIILNNNAHAMCVIRDRLYCRNHDDRNRFHPAALAEGMAAMFPGMPSFAVRKRDELRTALSAPSGAGPRFIAIDCDPDEIPPFTPFLAALE